MNREAQFRVSNWRHQGRVFIPMWRMRAIKHETDVANAVVKRAGKGTVGGFTCSCGSLNCLGNIFARMPDEPTPPPPPVRKRRSRTLNDTEIRIYG